MSNNDIKAIVLAAGKGVRMESDLPKVFHEILGRPMLAYVLDTLMDLEIDDIYVVVGHKKELIIEYFEGWPLQFVSQDQQIGTAHAVMQAKAALAGFSGTVLVLNGDMPLISKKTIFKMLQLHAKNSASATVLTAKLNEPGSFGRIIREANGEVIKIVEAKDASPEELKVNEVNTGTYCFDAESLVSALEDVKAENVQKEYYLTDTIEILKEKEEKVFAYCTDNPIEAMGVNTKDELGKIESLLSA
ncbi:MAG: NTP transferase domain-containing protein [Candidatus Saganbacteria bacterium]|nr:NTP transferase domain-containing protein [Candidatus Saganbacteria bacterium]